MLKSISAQAVLFGLLVLTGIYYVIILAIYYRRELKSRFQGKPGKAGEAGKSPGNNKNGQQETEKEQPVK